MQVHNYFPPQAHPFVFNLCDPDPAGRARSLNLAQDAIEFGLTLGSTVYSCHAGFLGTPAVSDLGRTWGVTDRIGLDEGVALFAQSVAELSAFARERGVELLVENNVLTLGTAERNGEDILLMTTPDGIRDVLGALPSDVRLLMDVAHLAVSAGTLGFGAGQALTEVADLVGGYHLSENDGKVDSNEPIGQHSWFWEGLNPDAAFVTLEINPDFGASFADQVLITEAMLERNLD
jgi:sugar phosphate isomerase/epimerase